MSTDIAATSAVRTVDRAGRPAHAWLAVPAGAALGLLLGVVARAWMRVIADEPDFSWAGSLFIVGAFACFGAGQAVAGVARRVGWRRRGVTTARVAAAALTLPLFTGAGAIMLPTVLMAALACWRDDWPRWGRAVAGFLALPVVVIVVGAIIDEFGADDRTVVGVAGFLVVYGVVIAALRATAAPLHDGWRLGRAGRSAVIVVALVIAAVLAASLRGV